MNLRKCICILTAAVLLLAGTGLFVGRAAAETAETTEEKKPFTYEHDPRDNPVAMRDAVYNPDAVYGFSPNPESSRTGAFADAIDWGNEEQVAAARAERQVYHDSMRELYVLVMDMLEKGERVEIIARTVSRRRNELRLEAVKDDPEALALTKQSNLETYGNEEGPTPEYLFEKYGSWQKVLEKALGTNPGMDACLGMYDEYYDLYEITQDPEDAGTPEETEEPGETAVPKEPAA